jgi:hypothetical protein
MGNNRAAGGLSRRRIVLRKPPLATDWLWSKTGHQLGALFVFIYVLSLWEKPSVSPPQFTFPKLMGRSFWACFVQKYDSLRGLQRR